MCVQKEDNIRLHIVIFSWVGVETSKPFLTFVVEIAEWSPKM